jgi:hypothetical protein
MGDVVRIVRIDIHETESGILCATSSNIPGMVIMHRDMRRIRADLPVVIQKLLKRREGIEYEVREVAPGKDDRRLIPDWAAIPTRKAA